MDGTEELIVGTPTGCKICRPVKRRSKAGAVQEELEFMRQLKVFPEIPDDLVLKVGKPEEFEAYRLLLRRYEPQTTATTATKLVELLSTQFAGNLLDLCAVEKWDRNTRKPISTRTQQAEFKSELGQYFIVKQLENPWPGTKVDVC